MLDMGVKNYSEAVAACRSMNMQMAVIRSQEELNAVKSATGGSTGRPDYTVINAPQFLYINTPI